MPSNSTVLKFLAVLTSATACAAFAAPFAYVPNEGAGTVSVIDTQTDEVVAEIAAGKKPRGLAAGKDKQWLYVSDQPNNQLQIIDLRQPKLAGSVALGESP